MKDEKGIASYVKKIQFLLQEYETHLARHYLQLAVGQTTDRQELALLKSLRNQLEAKEKSRRQQFDMIRIEAEAIAQERMGHFEEAIATVILKNSRFPHVEQECTHRIRQLCGAMQRYYCEKAFQISQRYFPKKQKIADYARKAQKAYEKYSEINDYLGKTVSPEHYQMNQAIHQRFARYMRV